MDLRPELLPPSVSVAAFNQRTGHAYTAVDFAGYDGSRSLDEFAREAARPLRPRVPGVTRDELVEIVRRVMTADPATDYYLRFLEANVPHPRVSELIFHPPAELENTAEAVVDAALGYRAIAL
ncbi:hypothetical protein ACWC5C_02270 [Streptomyces sp. NPDC001700]